MFSDLSIMELRWMGSNADPLASSYEQVLAMIILFFYFINFATIYNNYIEVWLGNRNSVKPTTADPTLSNIKNNKYITTKIKK